MRLVLILIYAYLSPALYGQNTIGTLLYDESHTSLGYNLFTPNNQNVTYLIDQCGQVINTWVNNDMARLGADQYLLSDGSLLIAKTDVSVTSEPTLGAGGAGGVIEIRNWDNELKWQYIIQDSLQRQHHDVHMMPNGNVLAIVWDRYFLDDMVTMGFDSTNYTQTELWPDKIVEIDTSTNQIVWEWKAWDHMIQNFDNSKPNFGVVANHPELININYQQYTFDRQDWMHSNAIDYNPQLDQVMISVRNFQEVWVIDHSTTTIEASGHTGGNSDKGGDLLYRWGNPEAYQQGSPSDRKLFVQHDATWIDDPTLSDSPYFNMISIFNNFVDDGLSLGVILNPSFNDELYAIEDQFFLPSDFTETFSHPEPSKQFSTAASNFQLLANGNVMLHAARQGRTIELDSDGSPVWEYLIPIRNGFPVEQGAELSLSQNFTFSSRRYESDYSGFEGKDLVPNGYIEINPDESSCMITTIETTDDLSSIRIYPNPIRDRIFIESEEYIIHSIDVFNLNGVRQYINWKLQDGYIDIDHLSPGMYLLIVNGLPFNFVKL